MILETLQNHPLDIYASTAGIGDCIVGVINIICVFLPIVVLVFFVRKLVQRKIKMICLWRL